MPAACEITVRFHEPPADLAPFFTSFYRADLHVEEGRIADALQPEWGGIRFFTGDRPSSRIGDGEPIVCASPAQGPTTMPVHFEVGTASLWGIGIMPLGWATFIDRPAHELANCIFDARSEPAFAGIGQLAGRLTADRDREAQELEVIVGFFRDEARRLAPDRARIQAIHQMLLDASVTDVASMAQSAGLSQRTLERCCRDAFGFPPKLLLRRQRFMRSLARFIANPSAGWINAMDETYFDQSQFVRDSRTFLGTSPSDYVAQDHPVLRAFMQERQRVLGSPVQTLDQPD